MKILLFVSAFVLAATTCGAVETVTIAPGVELIPGAFVPGRQPDGNTVLYRAPEGLIVFDTGRHSEHTQEIVDYAKNAGLPIRAVVNSHWHLDHVGGNPRIRAVYPDVRVYASGAIHAAMDGFLADYRRQLDEATAHAKDEKTAQSYRDEIAIIDAGRALYPDEIIDKPGKRRIAGHDFDVRLQTRAVTAGDVWLYDPATRTLAAGDLVTLPAPLLDTACPARWNAALADLDRVPFKTLVPGHGTPMSRAQFGTWRLAYTNLLDCTAGALAKSACIDGWVTDAAPLLAANGRAFARSLLDYYIDYSLRAPKAKIDKLCAASARDPPT